MELLAFSLSTLFVALILHILVWRVALPASQTVGLLKIFALVYACSLAASFLPSIYVPRTVLERLHFTLFYIPTVLAYCSLFSLVEHESPSLAMIAEATKSPQGCAREEFLSAIGGQAIVGQRLEAAEGNGLLLANRGGFVLTVRGRFYASLFELIARIFKLDEGG
jgi:hypothetical protein